MIPLPGQKNRGKPKPKEKSKLKSKAPQKAKSRAKLKVSPGQLAADKIGKFKEFLRTKTLEAAIPQDFKKNGVQLVKYERIGGLTNKNYKLLMGDETLVLRLPGRGTGRFINRSHERANQFAAARAGFTPPVLYFNKFTGVKVSTFLQEATVLSPVIATLPDNYLQVAVLLRQFHNAPLRFANTFNGFAMTRIYERVARSRFEPFYAGFREMQSRFRSLEVILKTMPVTLRVCHNDLVPENILIVDGRIQLIDWEYSGMNDPAWDIGSFLLESEFDPGDTKAFIAAYLPDGADSAGFMFRVRVYQAVQDYLWSLWSLMLCSSHRNSERGTYYRRYGEQRFARAGSSLDALEMEYGMQLKVLSS
jgi:thiamine kinase-like enzyme